MASIRLLVILNADNNVPMELPNGVPDTVEELIEEVKNVCGIDGHIRLQYQDTNFGNMFVNLNSTTVVKGLTVLRVVQIDLDTTII